MADPTLVFYHMVPSRSMIVHWMLHEVGAPFETKLLNGEKEEQLSDEYRRINPMGKVPAIQHGDAVVTEAAAICAYLADAFPDAGLAPDVRDPLRGPYYRWLFFGPSCIEPAVLDRSLGREPGPRSRVGYGSYEDTLDAVEQAVKGREYIVGDRFTAADVIIGSQLSWGMLFETVDKRDAFVQYEQGLTNRPAYLKARELDAPLMPKG